MHCIVLNKFNIVILIDLSLKFDDRSFRFAIVALPKTMVDYSTIFFRKAGSSYASYKGERQLVKFTVPQLQVF